MPCSCTGRHPRSQGVASLPQRLRRISGLAWAHLLLGRQVMIPTAWLRPLAAVAVLSSCGTLTMDDPADDLDAELKRCRDDGNACTSESLVQRRCVRAPVADGTACAGGTCQAGQCSAPTPDAGAPPPPVDAGTPPPPL